MYQAIYILVVRLRQPVFLLTHGEHSGVRQGWLYTLAREYCTPRNAKPGVWSPDPYN